MSDVGGGDKRLIFGESNLCKNHLMAGCVWEKPISTGISECRYARPDTASLMHAICTHHVRRGFTLNCHSATDILTTVDKSTL